jgi:hypothetical protein
MGVQWSQGMQPPLLRRSPTGESSTVDVGNVGGGVSDIAAPTPEATTPDGEKPTVARPKRNKRLPIRLAGQEWVH